MTQQLEARLCQRIAEVLPALALDTVRLQTEGFDSDALIVNEQWVFRFARRPDVAAQLEVERALLPTLGALLPIAIPQFDLFEVASDTSLPFVRYGLLPGVQLRAAHMHSFAAPQRDHVARQIGEFLRALHSFPAERAQQIAPTMRFSARAPLHEEYLDMQRAVFPLLSEAEQRWAHALYAAANDERVWSWTPVVTHNDLNADHMLFDPRTQRISGIIDWGDIALGDPANDFAALFEYGDAFVESVFQHYRLPVDHAFRVRAATLLPRTIFGNLRYLVQHNQHAAIERNLRELRERTTARTLQALR